MHHVLWKIEIKWLLALNWTKWIDIEIQFVFFSRMQTAQSRTPTQRENGNQELLHTIMYGDWVVSFLAHISTLNVYFRVVPSHSHSAKDDDASSACCKNSNSSAETLARLNINCTRLCVCVFLSLHFRQFSFTVDFLRISYLSFKYYFMRMLLLHWHRNFIICINLTLLCECVFST